MERRLIRQKVERSKAMSARDQYQPDTNSFILGIKNPENIFSAEEFSLEEDVYPIGRQTNHILIIDSDGLLRSKLARFVLLTAKQYGRSCAIYHLSYRQEQAELTYFQPADISVVKNAANTPELDFAIYEASSCEIATKWLQRGAFTPTSSLLNSFSTNIQRSRQLRLTVVIETNTASVVSHDEELNLINFLEEMAAMSLPVNLMFASYNEQDQKLVQELLRNEQPYLFINKKTDRWSKLPLTLVKQSDFFIYQPLKVGITLPVAKKYNTTSAA